MRYLLHILVVFVALVPSVGQAFTVTNTTAIQDDNHTLFLIEFEVGYLNATATTPILAIRSEDTTPLRQPGITFGIYEKGVYKDRGEARGIVLGNTSLTSRGYQTAPGDRNHFTLVVPYRGVALTPEIRVGSFSQLAEKADQTYLMLSTPSQLSEYRVAIE